MFTFSTGEVTIAEHVDGFNVSCLFFKKIIIIKISKYWNETIDRQYFNDEPVTSITMLILSWLI